MRTWDIEWTKSATTRSNNEARLNALPYAMAPYLAPTLEAGSLLGIIRARPLDCLYCLPLFWTNLHLSLLNYSFTELQSFPSRNDRSPRIPLTSEHWDAVKECQVLSRRRCPALSRRHIAVRAVFEICGLKYIERVIVAVQCPCFTSL